MITEDTVFPNPHRLLTRQAYIQILDAALELQQGLAQGHTQGFAQRFAREAALDWLATYPGDLAVGLRYAWLIQISLRQPGCCSWRRKRSRRM